MNDKPEPSGKATTVADSFYQQLSRRGHTSFNWSDVPEITLPNGVVSQRYRVGELDDDTASTVFRVYYPPGCEIEPHTHECDYTEIIVSGSQKVGRDWHYPGDIRIGLANRAYGPLIAGPDGAVVLFFFKDGRWPAYPVGKNDGSTLFSDQLR